jgi:hypothetical protein
VIGAQRLANGKIRAPASFTYDDPEGGHVSGEGQVDLKPGDPDYAEWDAWLKAAGAEIDATSVLGNWHDGVGQ